MFFPALRICIGLHDGNSAFVQAITDIDHICTSFFHRLSDFDAGFQVISVRHKFIRTDPDTHWESRAHLLDPRHDLRCKTKPVFKGTAVLICPMIVARRKELIDQISMGRMDFHPICSAGAGNNSSGYKLFY